MAEELFPSPYGVTVIKSGIENDLFKVQTILFPSPYGVTVIKSELKEECPAVYFIFVSVPLRGNGN